MKGSPLRDLILIIIGAALCLIPLRLLTRPVSTADRHVAGATDTMDGETNEMNAWLDLRFSHAPEVVRILHHGRLLFEGGGATREDADLKLQLSGNRNVLDCEFRWPEAVEEAYAELKLEAEDLPVRQLGFWGRGEEKRSWTLVWEQEQ